MRLANETAKVNGRRLSEYVGREAPMLEAQRYLYEHAVPFADPIPQETMEVIQEVMAQAVREGWSVDLTAKRLDELFDAWIEGGGENLDWFLERKPLWRREMIARDQLMRSSNASTMGFYHGWGVPYKAWLATLDDRTRPAHVEAHMRYNEANAIPVEEPFILMDGSRVMFPGDPSLGAAADQIINCRCTTIPVWGRATE